ncbi:MAG: biotin--[acetyl-CoA-carboxylase] ligase [Gemmatimonadales bacterium]
MTVHRLDRVGSTQDEAHRLAAEGAPAGTVVVAAEQDQGRGTRGREWTSGRGGLWLTAILRPREAPLLEGLSLRIGLALAPVLEAVAPGGLIQLKWPNDLVAANRKLGGILCEARWVGDRPGWVAVGVGINVRNPLPRTPGMGAVSLEAIGSGAEAADLEGPVIAAVLAAGERAGPLSDDELAEFERRDWLRDRTLLHPVAGRAEGPGPDGALRVRQPDGQVVLVRESVTPTDLAPDPGSH